MAEPTDQPQAPSPAPDAAPPPEPGAGAGEERFVDPAGEHLAGALRTSFRLLGATMVVGVLAFLAMGFDFVQPGEVAIRSVFGKVVGTTPEGLAYNWPEPIGRIDKVKVGERTFTVQDFWMNETKEDQLQPDLRKREAPRGGLRPGYDGFLLTGDRNVLHLRLKCTWVVDRTGYELAFGDPLAGDHRVHRFVRDAMGPDVTVADARERWKRQEESDTVPPQLSSADGNEKLAVAARRMQFPCTTPPALLYRMHVSDPNETMRSVLCEGAIRAAATRTADGLLRTEQAAFERDVRRAAQEALDALRAGILVRTVKVDRPTWPLRTLPDYDAAQSAVSDAESQRSQARRDAVSLLNATAGPVAADKLVGKPADVVAAPSPPARAAPAERIVEYDLIGQYNDAVRRGDSKRAEELLEHIGSVLVTDAEGLARRVLSEAGAYRSTRVQAIKARVAEFRRLLAAYRENPSFTLQRWWVETREEVLDHPMAIKHYLLPGPQKIVIRINTPPEYLREVRRAGLVVERSSGGTEDTKATPE